MSTLDLPVLDLARPSPTLVRDLSGALGRWGFAAIAGHGIAPDLLDAAYAQAAAFFALPDDQKRRYETPHTGRQRGYTGFGVEHAKDREVHDLKEFWQVGRSLGPDHPAVRAGRMPDNVWPTSPPGFAEVFGALFDALDGLANRLLAAIAEGSGLDADGLLEAVRDGNSVLRVIHYPPLRADDPPGAVRAAAHEDVNLLTVLPAATHPGLELMDRDGTWRPIRTPPDVMVVDTGDLFQHLTGGALPATTHRVTNPEGTEHASRYSLPFFVHPRPEWVIRPVRGDGPALAAGEILARRLREIGVG